MGKCFSKLTSLCKKRKKDVKKDADNIISKKSKVPNNFHGEKVNLFKIFLILGTLR